MNGEIMTAISVTGGKLRNRPNQQFKQTKRTALHKMTAFKFTKLWLLKLGKKKRLRRTVDHDK